MKGVNGPNGKESFGSSPLQFLTDVCPKNEVEVGVVKVKHEGSSLGVCSCYIFTFISVH